MKITWKLREYLDGDENELFELFQAVYGKAENKEEWIKKWKWQYLKNPSGKSIIVVADSDNKIVGNYSLVPIKMKIHDKIITGSQAIDLMVYPDYQRQGMFVKMALTLFDLCGNEKIDITYGFPNEMAYGGHLKTGWSDIGKIPRVFKPIHVGNTIKARIHNKILRILLINLMRIYFYILNKSPKPPIVNNLKIIRVSCFDDRINRLWRSVSKQYSTIVIRNKKYLNWRYIDIPHKKYSIFIAELENNILGYIVLKCVEKKDFKGGQIVDIFANLDERILNNLLYIAIEYFRKEKVDSIYCWLPNNKIYKKVFKRNGFFYQPPTPRFIVRNNSSKLSEDLIYNFNDWFITMGDSDLD